MNKAIFLDKDGTLVKDVPYNVATGNIELEEGVAEGLKALKRLGYKLVLVTNQPGLALGYFDEHQLFEAVAYIQQLARVQINGLYYCPHAASRHGPTNDGCGCRKPRPGLLLKAAEELDIDLAQSWMIGDILNDVEAGNKAGCSTVLIDNGNETEWELHKERVPDYIASNFLEAAIHIKRMSRQTPAYERSLA